MATSQSVRTSPPPTPQSIAAPHCYHFPFLCRLSPDRGNKQSFVLRCLFGPQLLNRPSYWMFLTTTSVPHSLLGTSQVATFCSRIHAYTRPNQGKSGTDLIGSTCTITLSRTKLKNIVISNKVVLQARDRVSSSKRIIKKKLSAEVWTLFFTTYYKTIKLIIIKKYITNNNKQLKSGELFERIACSGLALDKSSNSWL